MPTLVDLLMGGDRGLLMEKVMDFRARQHNLITSNVANAETPNYKATHIEFESLLREAMRKEGTLRLARTHPAHLTGAPSSLDQVRPQYLVEAPPTSGNDYNSVDLEREMVRMTENQMMYQTAAQLLQGRFRGLGDAISQSAR